MEAKTNIPYQGRALDAVKIIAAVLMLLDHIDAQIFTRSTGILYLLGRGAYPLFAFAAAASILRGGAERAPVYGRRLLVIGLVILPITQVFRDIEAANIMFTLAIGLGFAPMVLSMSANMRHAFFAFCIAGMMMPNIFEFGWAGAALPSAFLLYMQGDRAGIWIWPLMAVMNFGDMFEWMKTLNPTEIIIMMVIALATIVVSMGSLFFCRNLPNDNTRLMPKYFLHIFYPVHILALALIGMYLL